MRHYVDGTDEASRLGRTAHGRLEFLRTRELLRATVPTSSVVLDVGGSTGVHAAWLADDGHTVHLVDVVADHVAVAARLPGVTAELGDARALSAVDESVDVVLLLGPLYHLTFPADRVAALAEARRVLRPDGVLAAGAISRYLSVVEAGATGGLTESMTTSVRATIETGTYDAHLGFVPAHFHTATELADEVTSAGFRMVEVHGVEGPTWATLDAVGERFEELAPAALRAARLVARDPLMINASAHLLALARK